MCIIVGFVLFLRHFEESPWVQTFSSTRATHKLVGPITETQFRRRVAFGSREYIRLTPQASGTIATRHGEHFVGRYHIGVSGNRMLERVRGSAEFERIKPCHIIK